MDRLVAAVALTSSWLVVRCTGQLAPWGSCILQAKSRIMSKRRDEEMAAASSRPTFPGSPVDLPGAPGLCQCWHTDGIRYRESRLRGERLE